MRDVLILNMCKTVWNLYLEEESMYFILVAPHAFELINRCNGEPSVFITVCLKIQIKKNNYPYLRGAKFRIAWLVQIRLAFSGTRLTKFLWRTLVRSKSQTPWLSDPHSIKWKYKLRSFILLHEGWKPEEFNKKSGPLQGYGTINTSPRQRIRDVRIENCWAIARQRGVFYWAKAFVNSRGEPVSAQSQLQSSLDRDTWNQG
jgi:hypothetical protein